MMDFTLKGKYAKFNFLNFHSLEYFIGQQPLYFHSHVHIFTYVHTYIHTHMFFYSKSLVQSFPLFSFNMMGKV
jgi:hypothetical protein